MANSEKIYRVRFVYEHRDFIMAQNCNCDLQDDWMLVEMGESGPIAVEESDIMMEKDIRMNLAAEKSVQSVQAVREKDGRNLDSDMNTYYISRPPTKELLDNLLNMMTPRKPKAVLVILPNCEASESSTVYNVSSCNIETSMDFRGLATEKDQEKYALQSGLDLARRTKELLLKAGIKAASAIAEDRRRGVQLPTNVYRDTPVCQLSVQSKRDGVYHYNLGRVLSPLKQEGVLILASGTAAVNNNGLSNSETNGSADKFIMAFDNWLSCCLTANRFEEIIQFERRSPSHARTIHPFSQRFYPLLVSLGAAGKGAIAKRVDNGWAFGSQG